MIEIDKKPSSELRFLTPTKVEKSGAKKYCRFKKMKINCKKPFWTHRKDHLVRPLGVAEGDISKLNAALGGFGFVAVV